MAFDESVFNEFMSSIYSDLTPEQSVEIYTKFANYYDDICDFESYRAPEVAVDGFVALELDKSIRILDVGAGQGRLGRLLKNLGYNNVDAIDGTPAMLNVAESDGLYKNYIHCLIHKDTKLPIEDNVYDATIASGSMGKGHISIEVLSELTRITKPGGVITWSLEHPKFLFDENTFNNCIKSLCNSGKCQVMSGYPKKDPRPIYLERDGFFYVLKVL